MSSSGDQINSILQDSRISTSRRNTKLRNLLNQIVPDLKTDGCKDSRGNPPIYIAAATNNSEAIRILHEAGSGVDVRNSNNLLPIHAALTHILGDATDTIRLLLALGCSCKQDEVPIVLVKNEFLHKLTLYREKFVREIGLRLSPSEIFKKLGDIPVNESVYYWFRYVRKRPALNPTSIARTPRGVLMTDITGPVGQRLAKHAFRRAIAVSEVDFEGRNKPRVMAFCGPSGHGKTELAKQYAKEAGIPTEQTLVVDCAIEFDSAISAIGASVGYEGGRESSRLNSFFVNNNNRKAVLILDEFEKSNVAVRNALLSIFDGVNYRDRTDKSGSTEVNLSGFLIILTTNAADGSINAYCEVEANKKELMDDAKCFKQDVAFLDRHLVELTKVIREPLQREFGYPLCGRISSYIPFIPFTRTEAAVVADTIVRPWVWRARQAETSQRKFGYIDFRLHGEINSYISLEYSLGTMGAKNSGVRGIDNWFDNNFRQLVSERFVQDKINSGSDSNNLRVYHCFVVTSNRQPVLQIAEHPPEDINMLWTPTQLEDEREKKKEKEAVAKLEQEKEKKRKEEEEEEEEENFVASQQPIIIDI